MALNMKPFESGEFCGVNTFLSNPGICPLEIFWVRGRARMVDLAFQSRGHLMVIDGRHWLSHSVIGPGSLEVLVSL